MDRRTFSLSALAFTLAPALPAQPSAADSEVNAVYARVLSSLPLTENSKLYLEASTYSPECPSIATREYTAMERAAHVPGAYPNIRPPADRLSDAAEIIADFKLRLAHPLPLDAPLPTTRPCQLLSEQQVRAYRRANSFDPKDATPMPALSAKQQRELEALPGITSLAPVGFNHDRTLALTASRWFRGGRHEKSRQIQIYGGASSETWYVMEKQNGSWRRADWPASGSFNQA